MTSIGATGYPLHTLTPLDTSNLRRVQASPEQMAEMKAAMEAMYRKPVGPADNAAENLYAEVRANGKVVARLYNSGVAELLNGPIANLTRSGSGPQLAQDRAEQIAKDLGGTIVKAPTAQTQEAWKARPRAQWVVDYEAMERSKAAAQRRIERNALIQAQLLVQAQSSETKS